MGGPSRLIQLLLWRVYLGILETVKNEGDSVVFAVATNSDNQLPVTDLRHVLRAVAIAHDRIRYSSRHGDTPTAS